ncbi:MAG: hypothetical protein APR53_08210 [Methanoculleus sp. SDB]|nr:MAG: hypothetical protein APR53_08210 [Methanoculleus sp. SDB]
MIHHPFVFDSLKGPAVVLGMAGAVPVTAKARGVRRAGFGCWIGGNVLWVVFGLAKDNLYLTTMFGFYWLTAVSGWMNICRT